MATGSEGKIEEVAEKSTGHGIETTDEKEVGEVKPPETAAFQNVEAEKVVPASFSTETPKPGIQLYRNHVLLVLLTTPTPETIQNHFYVMVVLILSCLIVSPQVNLVMRHLRSRIVFFCCIVPVKLGFALTGSRWS